MSAKRLLLIFFAVMLIAAKQDEFGLVTTELRTARQELKKTPAEALAYSARLHRQAAGEHPAAKAVLVDAVAFWTEAAAYVHLNEPELALKADALGLEKLQGPLKRSFVYGELLLERANAVSLQGRLQEALSNYQAAYRVFESINSRVGQSIALIDLSASYSDAGDYSSALKYGHQALDLQPEDPSLVSSALINLGVAYAKLQKFDQAAQSYQVAITQAYRANRPALAIQLYDNLARTQLDAGHLDDAQRTLNTAFSLSTGAAKATLRSALYSTAAQIALQQKRLSDATNLISKAAANQGAETTNAQLREFHDIAYHIAKATGNALEALHHLEKFKILDDDARNILSVNSTALIAARFDFANQDLKISRLRAGQAERDAALARSQARFHTALLAALSIISGLLAAGIFVLGRSRNQVRAANRSLQGTNAELERALAAKGEFLSTTSHEIRTPLNGILGMTQVLLADRGVPPPVRERVELIHGAGETMRALVDDILDMAKMETGELRLHPAPMDLRRLLEQAGAVWAGQAETKRLGLRLDLDRCPHGIVADEVRLRQVVFNLMSNAIKFTDRGQVGLSAWTEDRDGAERLMLRIDDSGIGIPPDRLAEIFESFRQVDGGVTRRHGGTGLGLAICRNIARAMGGDVDVDSVLGAGSRFTVELPLERTSVEAGPAAAAAAAAPAESLAEARLLLFEPNPLSQGILRALVAPQVAALEAAADRTAAAELLAAGGFHHLLADGAAFGLDAAAAAAFAAAQPVARTTLTWAQPDEAVRAALAGAGIQLVAKPVSPADLLAALRIGYDARPADRDIAA